MDTHGYLYNDTFDPSDPSLNLVMADNDGAGDNQFVLNGSLEAGISYTLVVVRRSSDDTGPYLIKATGPGDVQFTRIDRRSSRRTGKCYDWYIRFVLIENLNQTHCSLINKTNRNIHIELFKFFNSK